MMIGVREERDDEEVWWGKGGRVGVQMGRKGEVR